ncbi:TSYL2 protein, partial [Notiomystis cincta]|nr:TSYL2 protein [Notiomystis cincta]
IAALAEEGPETPGEGLETPGEGTEGPKTIGEAVGSLETTEEAKGGLEATITRCLEQEKGDLEITREVTEGLETTNFLEQEKGSSETTREVTEGLEATSEAMGDLEVAVTHTLEQNKGVLETPMESRESLETTREAVGGLESGREVTGTLGTTNGCKGVLETAVTRCLQQGRRSKGGLQTTTKVLGSMESDASPGGDLKSTSRRKAKTPVRPKGSAETGSTQCLERERSGQGDLETTREDTGSMESTIPGHPAGVPAPKEQVAEESAVISLDEDEEEEEEEERDEGPARYLAALEAVQLELEAVEEEAARAFRRLRARFCLRRRPHLQRRNRLIQHIPGFWVTTFLNHPQLSAMISDRDEDALSYMTSLQVPGRGPGGGFGAVWPPEVTHLGLQVEEFGQTRPGCRIRFFFSVNPYFQNDVVAKEFVRGPSG